MKYLYEIQPLESSILIKDIVISPDSQILVSSDGVEVRLWNLETGKLLNILKNESASTRSGVSNALAISPNGEMIAAACYDYHVLVWNLKTGQYLNSLKFSTEFLHSYTSVAFCSDNITLISGGACTTHTWNIQTGKNSYAPTGIGDRIAISPNDHIIAGELSKIEISEIPCQRSLRRIGNLSGCVGAVAITSDGKTCAAGIFDGTIKLWDWETYTELRTIKAHPEHARSISFSQDGKTLVSGSPDKTIKFWDVETGELKESITENLNKVSRVTLSANGKYLVSSDNQRIIKVWQL